MISSNRPQSIIALVQGNDCLPRGSVINESLIYLSYHNVDLAYAFQLSTLLLRYYRKVWLDRFEIDLREDWNARIQEARTLATGAIVVVSDDYLDSPYCGAEFEYFQARELPITAVIPRDFSTDKIASLSFSDWIDFRRWHDDPKDRSVENLLSQIPQSEAVAKTGERLDYLRGFIQDIEVAFSRMPTSYASLCKADAPTAPAIRPRMIQPSMLNDWDFKGEKAGSAAPVEDLLAWSQAERQFIVSGEGGSGKTCFARLLALQQAHSAMRDAGEAIPVWLDLAGWDERQTTLSEFMDSQWRLLTYWRHWLDERQTLLILDNFSDFAAGQPAQVSALTEWIEASPSQRFIVVSGLDARLLPDLPIARLGTVSGERAQSFASLWLNLDQQSSFRALVKQKAALIKDIALDDLSLGVELMAADRALAFTQWHRAPMSALIGLRAQQTPTASHDVDNSQLLAGLRQLAWSMTLLDNPRFVARESAACQAIDARVMDRALELGLIEAAGTNLRFQSSIFQWHLAASRLQKEGPGKHLKPPAFTDEGRIAGKWDDVALVLIDRCADDEGPQVINQLAEIDPFLAARGLRRHPALLSDCQESLITKLILFCAENRAAQPAFHVAIANLPAVNRAAELLIGKLGRLDNALQVWLWREIRALPLDLPGEFMRVVQESERDSPVSATEGLRNFGSALSLAYLVNLTAHQEARMRRKAFWVLGEVKYLPTGVFLLACLEDGDASDHDEIARALMKFSHSELLLRLLRWSQDSRRNCAIVVKALAEAKRLVASRLLALADARRLTLQPEFYDYVVNTDEGDIAIGLAQIAAESVALPESVQEAIRSNEGADESRRQLAQTIKHLPNREGFQQLVADISAVLRDPPEPTISAGGKIEALLYGKPLFDVPQAEAERAPADPIPADLRAQLRADDRLIRSDELPRLAEQPAFAALPSLPEAARADDVAVRLDASETRARFENEAALEYSDEEKIMRALEVLRDDDWGRRRKAARFLRRFARRLREKENPAILRLLCDRLEDDDWSARYACAEALAALQDKAAIPSLSVRIDDRSWIVQVAVVRALVELRASGQTSKLTRLLRSPRKPVREATAVALGEIGDGGALPALSQCFKRDADEFVRLSALKAIGRIAPEDARAWLALALSDSSVHLRFFALQSLGPQMTAADGPTLQPLLDDHRKPSGEAASIAEFAKAILRRIEDDASGALLEAAPLADERMRQ